MVQIDINALVKRSSLLQYELHRILGVHETSKSRVVLLEESYKNLTALNLKQDDLMRQSLRCIENELFRAAHVMGWAAFIDFIHEKLASDSFVKLNTVRPVWKISSTEDLREHHTDYSVIEAGELAGLYNKSERKALHGLLAKRNEAAHPSNYYPGLNESLGYISELLSRINNLQSRTY